MKTSMNSILFNLAGGAVLVTVVGYMVMAFFTSGKIERCSLRYAPGQQFALDGETGEALTPIELQARAGLREWGVLQNAKVVAEPYAEGGKALEVTLAKTESETRTDENGIGFVWPLSSLQGAQSACLSYHVMLPEGFEFKAAGYLPGLFGARDINELESEDSGSSTDGFIARVGWGQSGDVGMDIRSPASKGYWQGTKVVSRWPLGRWLLIEQEVKLNTPGQDDGLIRMWVDGELTVENTVANLRMKPELSLTGVISDIGYARSSSDPAIIKVSPFVVQWQ